MNTIDINPLVDLVRASLPQERFGAECESSLKGEKRYVAGATSPSEITVYEVQDTGGGGVKDNLIGRVNLSLTPSRTSTPQADITVFHPPKTSEGDLDRITSVMRAVAEVMVGNSYWTVYYSAVRRENEHQVRGF